MEELLQELKKNNAEIEQKHNEIRKALEELKNKMDTWLSLLAVS